MSHGLGNMQRAITGRRGRFSDVPDMTPEEHERRGDAAVALFRELVRRARNDGPRMPRIQWV
jgi:hypothetical protein